MRIATGKVVSGKVIVEGEPLAEGATVTVLAPDDESLELAPEQEALLLASLQEAEQGRVVEGPAVLRDLAGQS
jgi:redox-sensitive bicupin YhaK (pirin superfamily)